MSSQDALTETGWPELSFAIWRDTGETVLRWLQIVGKTRLALAPMMNHWWQVPLYLSARGFTTSPMPYSHGYIEVELDFIAHELQLRTTDGSTRVLPLIPRSVAEFYHTYMGMLHDAGVDVSIWPVPVEIEDGTPFSDDEKHGTYDADAMHRTWQAFLHANRVLTTFRGGFLGKSSPVHLFWGAFDLATTRFSGRPAPLHPGGIPNVADWVMQEAYSHEVASAGFWPGSDVFPQAAFYAYAYPEPAGYTSRSVAPSAAYYDTTMREFILPYEVVQKSDSPERDVLAFLQSTYDAAADLARWDRLALDRPTVPDAPR